MPQNYNAVQRLKQDATPPPEPIDTAREMSPIVWLDEPDEDNEDVLYDFRPIDRPEVDEELVGPKDSSAPVSADLLALIADAVPENPVPVVKDSGEPPVSAPSTPTSSSPTSDGKNAPPASE